VFTTSQIWETCSLSNGNTHTSSEDWFAELWDELHLPITDLDTFLSEIIQDLTNCFYKSESPTEIVGQIKCVKSRTFHKLLRQS